MCDCGGWAGKCVTGGWGWEVCDCGGWGWEVCHCVSFSMPKGLLVTRTALAEYFSTEDTPLTAEVLCMWYCSVMCVWCVWGWGVALVMCVCMGCCTCDVCVCCSV